MANVIVAAAVVGVVGLRQTAELGGRLGATRGARGPRGTCERQRETDDHQHTEIESTSRALASLGAGLR
jgi:hypothetical protein